MNRPKSKILLPEYKGTDTAIVKCQICGTPIKRTLFRIRRNISEGRRTLCPKCRHIKLTRYYNGIEGWYDIKKQK